MAAYSGQSRARASPRGNIENGRRFITRNSNMSVTDCPNCGEPVAAFAKTCAHCGAPNKARRASFVIAASLLLLLVAAGAAIFAVVRWQRLPVGTQPATEDFGWLTAAMKDCDKEASGTPSTLHFLVIPLAATSADDSQWRRKSLDDAANAVLLPSDEALADLGAGVLKISIDPYEFRVRDEATDTIYKWRTSSGVKRFSAPDADSVEGFKVQFLTHDKARDDDWSASFNRRKGTCYWVNAVIGN